MPSSAFATGRFASTTVCGCFPPRPPPPATPCPACGLLVPLPLDALSLADRHAALTALPPDTPLALYGHAFLLSPLHARPPLIAQWRARGDALADAALAALASSRAPPTAAALRLAAAGGDAACAALLASATTLPPWADAARMARGGRVWFESAPVLGIALLNLSLLGGFGASELNAVLVAAGGLLGSRASVHQRITETLQFVNDVCTSGGLLPGGAGQAAVLSVRLLHARARARVLASARTGGTCPYGFGPSPPPFASPALPAPTPISAGDLLVTQLAFSLVMFMGAERAGLLWHVPTAALGDALHLWGVAGVLLGVPDEPALTAAAAAGSLPASQALLESLVCHLAQPGPSTRPLLLASLRAVAYRFPAAWSPAQHADVSAALAGPLYARALGLGACSSEALRAAGEEALRCAREEAAGVGSGGGGSGSGRGGGGSEWVLLAALRGGAARLLRAVGAAVGAAWAMAREAWTIIRGKGWRRRSGSSSSAGDVDDCEAAGARGRALLAPLALYPYFCAALPRFLRERLARANEAFLVALVAKRLGGRAAWAP